MRKEAGGAEFLNTRKNSTEHLPPEILVLRPFRQLEKHHIFLYPHTHEDTNTLGLRALSRLGHGWPWKVSKQIETSTGRHGTETALETADLLCPATVLHVGRKTGALPHVQRAAALPRRACARRRVTASDTGTATTAAADVARSCLGLGLVGRSRAPSAERWLVVSLRTGPLRFAHWNAPGRVVDHGRHTIWTSRNRSAASVRSCKKTIAEKMRVSRQK